MKIQVLSLCGGIALGLVGASSLSAAGFFYYTLLQCAAATHPQMEPFYIINNDIKEKTYLDTKSINHKNEDIIFNLIDFTIFPNPCRGKKVYFKWRMEKPAPLMARIINAKGEQVHSFVVPAQDVTDLLWEVSGLPRGSYLFQVFTAIDASQDAPRLLKEAKIYLLPGHSK